MSSSSEDNGNAVSGEVVRGEVINREETRNTMVGAIFSRLSRLPFVNVWLQKKVGTAREVVKEETELFKDLVDHEKSFNRLLKIDLILRDDDATMEANAVAAENRLAEEKRKEAARKRDDAIYEKRKEFEEADLDMKNEYELKIREAGYKKRLYPLEREVEQLENPPEPEEQPSGRGRSEKQKLRERAYARRDREIKRIERKRVSPETKEALKRTAENELEEELRKIDEMP